MVEKIMLSDKDYEYLTTGIASGVVIGTIIGMLLQDIILGFAAGGVIGIILSFVYSYYRKAKSHKKQSCWNRLRWKS